MNEVIDTFMYKTSLVAEKVTAKVRAQIVAVLLAIGTFISDQRQEIVILIALAWWTWGLWSVSRAAAVGLPALTVLWLVIPSRPPLVVKRTDKRDAP